MGQAHTLSPEDLKPGFAKKISPKSQTLGPQKPKKPTHENATSRGVRVKGSLP